MGAATVAGVFFTFSTFTMTGLKRLSAAHGMVAMQAINAAAPSPVFMLLLFGTGAACLALGAHAGLNLDQPGAALRVIAAALYIAGVVLLTLGYHVPRNRILAGLDPDSSEGAAYWARYQREWVRMNHVRTVAPLFSALLLILSL
nr:anthrone oxygenase family protein [Thiorhodococcus mannitoliphagus]